MGDDGKTVSDVDMHSAFVHCRRAAYEAFEAGILYALEIIHKFKSDYAEVVVSTVVPGYNDMLTKASAAMRMVEEGRKKGFDRTADHGARMAAFRELRTICEKLDVSRDEANLLISQQRRSGRQFVITVILAILALVATILFGIPAMYDWMTKRAAPTEVPAILPPQAPKPASPAASNL